MPTNPLIALQGQVPDVGQTFSNVLTNIGRMGDIQRAAEQAPVRQRLLEAQAQTAEAGVPTAQQKFNASQLNMISSLATGAKRILPDLMAGDIPRVLETLQQRKFQLENAGIPTKETDEAIFMAQHSPQELMRVSQQAIDLEQQYKPETASQFGAQQTFKDEQGNLFFGTTRMDPKSGRVESVLAPIGGSGNKPIGNVSLVSPLGQTAEEKQESIIATKAGEEVEKQKAHLKYKPQIETAVTAAKKMAEQQGEVFNELSQAKAALPGLTTAVDDLRELSKIATSTLGGRIFDAAVRETGFGATKGATARAKFIAIVNNQVLPLLKPTFGAAFTVQEGEALKATMGDPNASPEEKMAQLDAFIAQKQRDIETKQAQLGKGASPKVINFEDLP